MHARSCTRAVLKLDRVIEAGQSALLKRLVFSTDKLVFSAVVGKVQIAARLAAVTGGFSGAELANVVNEAALLAARADSEVVGVRELLEGVQVRPGRRLPACFHDACVLRFDGLGAGRRCQLQSVEWSTSWRICLMLL